MTEKRSAPHEPSCVGLAVKIIDALKGSGRIIWVEIKVLGEEPTGHAYVVPNKARGGKYPLNEPKYRLLGQERMTIEEVLKRGIDRTEEFQKLLEDMT